MIKIFLGLIFSCCALFLKAQSISGLVTTTYDIPLVSASIALRIASNKMVVNFTTTDKEGKFSFPFKEVNDSLEIRCSFIGYQEYIIKLPIQQKDVFFKIILQKKEDQLEEVLINSKGNWKSGDTSFYRVEAYKDGNERKLGDVIEKLPGFSRDENDKLVYKGKIIEKITIDGEDIFADKIGLLLKNVPVSVIENIQALENQTDKPLLKGLDGSKKVFLNLELKKNKVKSQIGDWEAGIDTEGKYLANIVLFSLSGKTKVAMIDNLNSQGNAIDFSTESEFKLAPTSYAESWLTRGQNLNTVLSLPNRYYINNQQLDSRIKIIQPISKKHKSQTEINFFKDNQTQLTTGKEILLNDSVYIERDIITNHLRKPLLIQLKQSINLKLSDVKEINIIAFYYGNFSKGSSVNIINQQSLQDSAVKKSENKYNQFLLSTNYVHRRSAGSALEMELLLSHGTFNQSNFGFSNYYPEIFNLSGTAYNFLNAPVSTKQTSVEGVFRKLNNKKKLFSNSTWKFHSDFYKYSSKSYLNSPLDVKWELNEFAGKADFINYGFNSSSFFNLKPIRSTLNVNYGYEGYIKDDGINKSRYDSPMYKLTLKHLLSKNNAGKELSFSFYNLMPSLLKYRNFNIPSNVNSYIIYKLPLRNSQNIDLIFRFPIKIKRHDLNPNFSLNYSSSGYVSKYEQNGILQFSTDSIINTPTLGVNSSLTYSHGSVPLKMLIDWFVYASFYSNRYFTGNNTGTYSSRFIYSNLSLKKNWKRKYFIQLKSNFNLAKNDVPYLGLNSFSKSVISYNTTLIQKYVVKKKNTFQLQTGYFKTDALSKNARSFFYMDAEYQFLIPKIPLQFTLNVQNITNQKYLVDNNTEPYYQSIFTVPLFQRSLMLRVRYEL